MLWNDVFEDGRPKNDVKKKNNNNKMSSDMRPVPGLIIIIIIISSSSSLPCTTTVNNFRSKYFAKSKAHAYSVRGWAVRQTVQFTPIVTIRNASRIDSSIDFTLFWRTLNRLSRDWVGGCTGFWSSRLAADYCISSLMWRWNMAPCPSKTISWEPPHVSRCVFHPFILWSFLGELTLLTSVYHRFMYCI